MVRAKMYGWKDTYTFTKAMGEMVVDNARGQVPVVIIRPSIVESTYREPFAGWMEGNRMMDPVIMLYGKGHISGFLANPNLVLDVVPVDMVVNATLAAIAKHGAAENPELNVYQIVSSIVNPLVTRDLTQMFYEHFSSSPWTDSNRRQISVSKFRHFTSMEEFSSHLREMAIHRTVANSSRITPQRMETICRKSVELGVYLATLYEAYTFYAGRFDCSNVLRLMDCMSEEEKKEFGFDLRSISWKDYIKDIHIPGLRRNVMKDRAAK
ncbi:hypothetical protein RJ640_010828 [Escallonia rubra]|uniref:Fatty acyl-CoA reductase n=1 Tax=Escallonia rubra TaxID=112253 RepID=A0AA88U965_9ASTE|nr:hypothetical protein RJ640_010828 [Escallonia rubra]